MTTLETHDYVADKKENSKNDKKEISKNGMAEEMRRAEEEKNDAENSVALTMYATKNVMNYTSNTPNLPTGVSLEGYYFDTVNWGDNPRPKVELVVAEINKLIPSIQEKINSYLKKNPANIIGLQQYLNGLLYAPDERQAKIDINALKTSLDANNMPLTVNENNPKYPYKIREDGLLGPQTYAAICCFKKAYRNPTTRNTNSIS